jgi:hypothetical protein
MGGEMIIDCDECAMQGTSACDDCIVTVLLTGMDASPADRGHVHLDDDESEALENLADVGLVAPLRLVPYRDDPGVAAG